MRVGVQGGNGRDESKAMLVSRLTFGRRGGNPDTGLSAVSLAWMLIQLDELMPGFFHKDTAKNALANDHFDWESKLSEAITNYTGQKTHAYSYTSPQGQVKKVDWYWYVTGARSRKNDLKSHLHVERHHDVQVSPREPGFLNYIQFTVRLLMVERRNTSHVLRK